jgi:hypothetical protein
MSKAEPLTMHKRYLNYGNQNGTMLFTRKQWRRIAKKMHHAMKSKFIVL